MKKKYFKRRIEFAYPDKKGKTKILGFDMIVNEEDKDNFDKYMNFLRSLSKALNLKEIPIYET